MRIITTRHAQITAQTLKKVSDGLRDIASRIGVSYTPDTPHVDSKGRPRRLPPTPIEFHTAIECNRFDSAIRWLSLSVSPTDAAELNARVKSVERRFHRAHFAACKLLNDDPIDATETVGMNYALPILSDLHYRILHDRFPGREEEPPVEELQPDLKLSHSILAEYDSVRNELRSVATALLDTAAIVAGREIDEDGPAGVGEWRWQGKLFPPPGAKKMDTRPWRFVKEIWDSPNRTANAQEIAGPVTGDSVTCVPDTTGNYWASRARKFFQEHDIPVKIAGSRGEFTLSVEKS